MAYVKLPTDVIAQTPTIATAFNAAEVIARQFMEFMNRAKNTHLTCPHSGCLLSDVMDMVEDLLDLDTMSTHDQAVKAIVTTLLFALDERDYDPAGHVSEIHTIFDPEN